jgi:hypothetical protein
VWEGVDWIHVVQDMGPVKGSREHGFLKRRGISCLNEY